MQTAQKWPKAEGTRVAIVNTTMLLEKDSFGSILQAARERRGVTLHEIAAVTNVPPELWRDFERSDVELWPDHLNTSGYVRQYAEAVGLDPDMVAEQFRKLYPQRSNRVEPILKANPSLVHELS